MTALMPETNAIGTVRLKAGWWQRLKTRHSALRRSRRARSVERLSDHLMRDIGLLRWPR